MFIWPDGRPGAVQRAGRERPLPSTQPSRDCCGFTNRLRTSPATVSEAAEVRRFVPIVSSSLPPADCLPGGGSRTAHRLRCVVGRWTCRAVRSKISSIRFDRAIERPDRCSRASEQLLSVRTWQRLIEASSRLDQTRPAVSANCFRTMETEESRPPACTPVRSKPCPVESDAISRPERPLQSDFCEASRRLDGRLPELSAAIDRASSVGRL